MEKKNEFESEDHKTKIGAVRIGKTARKCLLRTPIEKAIISSKRTLLGVNLQDPY